MRVIIALTLIALLMGLAGWLTIDSSSDKTSINIETDEIQRDTENAVDSTERMIESGTRAIMDDEASSIRDRAEVPEVERAAPISLDEEPVTTAPQRLQ